MNILVYLLYYLIGNRAKANLRKEKTNKLVESISKLLVEIEQFATTLNHKITHDEKNVLMKYLHKYCVLSKKKKPDINRIKYRKYNDFLKFEKKYSEEKPKINQFIKKESFEREFEKWSNIKPEMDYREKLQHSMYMRAIFEWKNNINETKINDKIYYSFSKQERQTFDILQKILKKFPNLKDKILEITDFLIEDRDHYL